MSSEFSFLSDENREKASAPLPSSLRTSLPPWPLSFPSRSCSAAQQGSLRRCERVRAAVSVTSCSCPPTKTSPSLWNHAGHAERFYGTAFPQFEPLWSSSTPPRCPPLRSRFPLRLARQAPLASQLPCAPLFQLIHGTLHEAGRLFAKLLPPDAGLYPRQAFVWIP